ncbi:MAG: hypothetical protein QXO16_07485 [Archaeoglobaceae archaeon]
MGKLRSRVEEMLMNRQDVLEKLLALEKERRGVEKDKLVFIGVAEVANHYWCAMKSLLRSKEEEMTNFVVYLSDRINYSIELECMSEQKAIDLIKRLPETGKEPLEVGNEITFSDLEIMLRAREEKLKERIEHWKEAETFLDERGERVMVVNPFSQTKTFGIGKKLQDLWALGLRMQRSFRFLEGFSLRMQWLKGIQR